MDSTYKIFQYDRFVPDITPASFQPFNSKTEADDYVYENCLEDMGHGNQFLLIEFLDDNTSKIIKVYGI